ncbi:hypothetical protein P9173_09585 [Bacillus safensis]|uniref:hypothetical protein n=1 Tax=Bacillus TaxID=1386 RepID=UPI00146EA7CC|nr:hypothetical protein [Bacillus safensis]MCM3365972.1 hypothetical protein [Bacillus safensis]MCY7542447.1 hypothetical protein [Bacillus safensis]MCY7552566.1 hypothetical protein [Bacillus safensis]MCY7644753.1 hypothetical protein [Bacillus safensis]MCY7655932.1 hypothetical protein [Bacillus safensis]
MKLYRVCSENFNSKEYEELSKAQAEYEHRKDEEMGGGVIAGETYVELQVSDDEFEDYEVIKKSIARIDEEEMKLSDPKDEGFDFDYWATWEEINLPS